MRLATSLRIMFNSAQKARFINFKPGPPEEMFVSNREIQLREDYHLLRIKAVGINRAEILMRQGKYGQPGDLLGLEAAGELISRADGTKICDAAVLLPGGGYADLVDVNKHHVIPLPKGFSYVEGAALAEAWLTAFQLIRIANVPVGSHIVIYAAASGVGTAAIQICKFLGLYAHAVVSGPQKAAACRNLGAVSAVQYKDNQNWAKQLIALNQNRRFQAILDCVGTSFAEKTIELLETDGCWVLYGLLSGVPNCQINLAKLLAKRARLECSLLKSRSDEYKAELVCQFNKRILPGFESKALRPVIDQVITCNWSDASGFVKAHKLMESNKNTGKIIVQLKDE